MVRIPKGSCVPEKTKAILLETHGGTWLEVSGIPVEANGTMFPATPLPVVTEVSMAFVWFEAQPEHVAS